MVAELELTPEQFREVAAACAHVRLGDEAPPHFLAFLVGRLGPHDPALADRLASASPDEAQRLFDRLRLHQISPE
jgi:hypothetical protein